MYYDKRLPQDYEDLIIQNNGKYPHCDAAVLHAPNTCQRCDYHVALQTYRLANHICFTGEDPIVPVEGSRIVSKAPCWSLVGRTIRTVYKWVHNRPVDYPAPKAGGGG